MKRFCYKAEHQKSNSQLTCILSAEWDTRRDAALAAKLKFDLPDAKFHVLALGGKVAHNKHVIDISEFEVRENVSTKPSGQSCGEGGWDT